jgi:hypothetical protein
MSRMPRIGLAAVLTALVVAAQLDAVAPLTDPLTNAAPDSLHLQTPWLYVALAPLFTLWDGVSMLSLTRMEWFLIGLAALYSISRLLAIARRRSLWRELRTFATTLILFLAFLVAGAFWHRPMLALAGVGPNEIVVDFHSHTNISHDVGDTWMRGFDREANRRWHARAGFDVAFITDHNVVSRQPPVASPQPLVVNLRSRAMTLCPGIEVSAWRAHIVLLGDTVAVDRRRYNQSLEGLLSLLQTSDTMYGSLSVASLPEYRRNHWDKLRLMTNAGLDGFEVINASPKANEITRLERDLVIEIARAHDRFVVGVSDSHGWGATSMVWNLVPKPMGGDICIGILDELRKGFDSVRIIERHRLRPDSWWPMWLTPAGVIWETWRSMGWALAASWLLWIWAWALLRRR